MSLHLDILPAATWADHVAAELAAVLRDRPGLRLVLPAGDTPAPVYAAVATLVEAGAATLAATEVLLLDEYLGLPPGHPARCDERLRRELLGRIAAPPAAFHAVPVDALAPEGAAAAHDAVAARGIDLALLGLGANGHVGLNEPGSRPDAPTRVVQLAPSSRRAAAERYGADPAPTAGITIGLDRLQAAGEIWLLVTGEAKAWILARALEEPVGPDCPASLLRHHPGLRVIADEAAAGELRRQT